MARLKDFPVCHRLMLVEPTEKMAALSKQIADLQARYRELEEKEQKRLWRGFIEQVRTNATDSLCRGYRGR